MPHKEKIERLAEALLQAKSGVVFSGAGISTESGIPDYRSKGGLWERFQPIYFDEFMNSRDARIEYWKRKSELYPDLIKARPNQAHLAVTRLYQMNLIKSVITQNVDGLHLAAGMPEHEVIELHGNTLRVRCMSCGKLSAIEQVQKRIEKGELAPECECGGYLKPDTISFGQSLPLDEINRAKQLCQSCDLLLVIGSTLLVQPASLLPGYAKQNGAFLAMINLSETPYDNHCDLVIKDYAGATMQALLERLEKRMNSHG